MNTKISDYISDRIGVLKKDAILEFAKSPNAFGIKNVIKGLDKQAFAINYDNKESYDFIYICRKEKLEGYILKSGLKIKYRTKCSLAFSQMLHESFQELDEIVVFNTYQKMLSSLLENDGIFTLFTTECKSVQGALLFKNQNGYIILPYIDKIDLYNNIFKGRTCKDDLNENKVYLMFNPDTDRIKIGFSKTTSHRERTLQSKEPSIKLVCSWFAPKKIETELKNKFAERRIRGEWFSLNPRELKDINEHMKIYKKVKHC